MEKKQKAFSSFFTDLFSWKGIKKQKWGWFTALFYAIGNIFWSIAAAFESVILTDRNGGKSPTTLTRIAGGFWISLTRELFYLIALLVLWGIRKPHALKKLRFTFTRGGAWMLLAVAANFIGNVSVVIGLVLLGSNASISSVLENSFIAITFFATFLTFRQKFEWKTFAGVLAVMGLILGIFFLQTKGWDKTNQHLAFIGMALVFAGNFGYMVKNMCAEYVYKNKLLDGETVQLFATFYSFFVGAIIAPIFLTIVQPILDSGAINADPYKYISHLWLDSAGMMVVFVIVAAFFLLTGRNCQYANTLVSGASLSNVFYQAKNLIIAIVNIPLYAIMALIFGSVYPFLYDPHGPQASFHAAIHHGGYDNYAYWILLILLFFAIAYTVLSGQEKFEETHAQYRIKKGLDPIERDKLGKGLLDNKAAEKVKASAKGTTLKSGFAEHEEEELQKAAVVHKGKVDARHKHSIEKHNVKTDKHIEKDVKKATHKIEKTHQKTNKHAIKHANKNQKTTTKHAKKIGPKKPKNTTKKK